MGALRSSSSTPAWGATWRRISTALSRRSSSRRSTDPDDGWRGVRRRDRRRGRLRSTAIRAQRERESAEQPTVGTAARPLLERCTRGNTALCGPALAPGWLRRLVSQGNPSFLLRGANSPAIEVWRARGALPALHGVGAHTGTGRLPADDQLRPAVLVLAGGGYTTLTTYEGEPAARLLAEMGSVACLLRYRLPPSHAWPAARDDLFAALGSASISRGTRSLARRRGAAGGAWLLRWRPPRRTGGPSHRRSRHRARLSTGLRYTSHVPTLCAVEGEASLCAG